jgi:biotin carboxyl carrier protein
MRTEKITIEFDGKQYQVEIKPTGPDTLEVIVDGQAHQVSLKQDLVQPESKATTPVQAGATASAQRPQTAPQPTAGQSGLIGAPMPGDIASITVKAGQEVAVGQELLVLEAMKMKNVIRSPQAGTVASVEVSVGQSVKFGAPLVRIE